MIRGEFLCDHQSLSAFYRLRKMRDSGAKALYPAVQGGTAKPVPFVC
jgi:hypothetical protein